MGSLPSVDAPTAPPPERVGRYAITGTLGIGGMATVYRGVSDELVRAIKVLHPDAMRDDALRKRFLAESRAISRFVHPNVIRIHEVGEDEHVWYAMDLVETGTVQRHLEQQGPFPPDEALAITLDVLSALGCAHAAGLVHRDVKPHNVLLAPGGKALLADFGSARQNGPQHKLTRTGETLGTVGYMAPEQRNDARAASPATDVYALGATIYAMVTGRPPLGLFEGELDKPHLLRLPIELRRVLHRSTRYHPDQRYTSARVMAEDVARARDALMGTDIAAEVLARFDDLLDTAVPDRDAMELSLTDPVSVPIQRVRARKTSEAQPVVRPKRPRSIPPPSLPPQRTEGFWASIVNAGQAFLAALQPANKRTIDPPPTRKATPLSRTASSSDRQPPPMEAAPRPRLGPVGRWHGRIAGMVPVRLDVEKQEGDRIFGTVGTTTLKGEVEFPFDAVREGAGWRIEERSDRPDRLVLMLAMAEDRWRGEGGALGTTTYPVELRRERSKPPMIGDGT